MITDLYLNNVKETTLLHNFVTIYSIKSLMLHLLLLHYFLTLWSQIFFFTYETNFFSIVACHDYNGSSSSIVEPSVHNSSC